MSTRHKAIFIVSLVLIFLVGLSFSYFVKNFPIVTFDPKLSLFRCLNLIVTLAIGFYIPLVIKKWIEDSNSIKRIIEQDIFEFEELSKSISDLIAEKYSEGIVTKEDKDKIIFSFHKTEQKLSSLEKQFIYSFPKNKVIITELKTEYIKYNDIITGGDLMISSFTSIPSTFYRENINSYSVFESKIRETLHRLHKI